MIDIGNRKTRHSESENGEHELKTLIGYPLIPTGIPNDRFTDSDSQVFALPFTIYQIKVRWQAPAIPIRVNQPESRGDQGPLDVDATFP